MENLFQIEETIGIPAKNINYISKPTFFINEEELLYRATIKCYDIDDQFVCNKEVVFSQEEYDSWGAGESGENYIYDLIFKKLDLILKSN